MSRANESAYPHDAGYDFKGQRVITANAGLTIREHFAALAMQGMLAAEQPDYEYRDSDAATREQHVAIGAVKQADALIAELAKPAGPSRPEHLVAAVKELLVEVDSEIDQRKTSGIDEDYLGLQRLVDNVREAMP